MKKTLFTRLASYSQNPSKQSLENFTTEVLVHLINNDRVFSRIFIRHIIRDGRILRRFKRASADSQKRFRNGIVDFVLNSGESRILVEVKITAAETETKIYGKGWVPQVQKYLDYSAGPVAYLTTKAVGAPYLRSQTKRFLGQCYFEDFYDQLVKTKNHLTDCGRLLLEFMEENDMKPLDPFTKQDLLNPGNAFSFAKKCESYLNDIVSKVEPEFRRIFRRRTGFATVCFSTATECAYISMKKNLPRYEEVKWAGISIWPENDQLVCGVILRVPQSDTKTLNRQLKWTEGDGFLYKPHPLKPHMRPGRFVKPIINDLKRLNRALKQAF